MRRGSYVVLIGLVAGALILVEANAASHQSGSQLVRSSYLAALLWLGACLVFLRAWLKRVQPEHGTRETPDPLELNEMLGLGVIVVLGLLFRRIRIDELPWGHAGVAMDAAYLSEVAFRILDGTQRFSAVVLSTAYYRDALLSYYLAGFYSIFGRRIEALRLACTVLSVANWVMLYFLLRAHTRTLAVLLGVVALYVLWDNDVILSSSGLEYVIVTPFLLATQLLLRRALRSGEARQAAVAGLVWGFGWLTYVAYFYFGMISLVIIAARRLRSWAWLRAFLAGGFLGALPKIVSVAFQTHYFDRAWDVARHDPDGRFWVWDTLRTNAGITYALLVRTHPGSKWIVMDPPLLATPLIPLIVLGLVVCLRHPRVPDHLWTIGVVGASVGVCILTYPMDYRLTNLLPAALVAIGIALARIDRLARHRSWYTWAVVLFVGWNALASVGRYFDLRLCTLFAKQYGTDEIALARAVAGMSWPGRLLLFGPDLDYRAQFFMLQHPDALHLNAGLDSKTQHEFSKRGEATVLENVAAITNARTPGGLDILIDPESPYAAGLVEHLVQHFGGTVGEPLQIGDGVVSRRRVVQHVRVSQTGPSRAGPKPP